MLPYALALELFKELCDECQLKKRKLASKGLVVKPIVSKEFNSRGQMDLIDMQSLSYGIFIISLLDHFISASMSGCNVNFLYNIKHIF
jgi:hypothetical protein